MEVDSNDTIQEQFLYEIDLAIENDNARMIYTIIKNYENKIQKSYIDFAYKVYNDLVMDELADMQL
jgi:uncharacterized protein YyaL (SSP411 family)